MLSEHNEEGIFNITNCARCHKSCNEDEVIRNEESNERLDERQMNNVKDYINSRDKKEVKENYKNEEKEDD